MKRSRRSRWKLESEENNDAELEPLQEPENTETHVHLDAQVPGEAWEMYLSSTENLQPLVSAAPREGHARMNRALYGRDGKRPEKRSGRVWTGTDGQTP